MSDLLPYNFVIYYMLPNLLLPTSGMRSQSRLDSMPSHKFLQTFTCYFAGVIAKKQ